jgi:metal-responsive CopG/Arc/MetJ family transcriptional regulator
MNTQKVAITMPGKLVAIIDDMSKKLGMSRSAYISTVLREKVLGEKDRELKAAYDSVFSDEFIRKEQLESTMWFEGVGSKEGQRW